MLILLTGATGFLGAHLALQLLDAGYHVRALYRSQAKRDNHPLFSKAVIDQIEWVEGDMFDQEVLLKAMQGVDRVYHCAAMVSFGRGQHAVLMRTNVTGTAEVVNSCLAAGVPRLVYVSSIAALGRDPIQPKVSESTPWKDGPHNSPYALSKFRAENEVWRGMEEGLEVIVVNPSVILGPGDWQEGSNRLFRTVYQGLKVYSPGQTGFVDVRDVAAAMIQLDQNDFLGKRFLLNGANLRYKTLFENIAKAFGVKPPRWCPPRWMSEVGWRLFAIISFFTQKEPFITRETVKSAYNSFEYDGSKICRELGFSYRPIEATIQESCAFMRQRIIG